MVSFVDEYRATFGVEPICKLLLIALSTYYDHLAKRRDVDHLSSRARKVWRQMKREGFDIARCTVERLMRSMGLQGGIPGKTVRTTVPDKSAPSPPDRVNRQFRVPAPKRLWVSDFTYVAT